MTFGPAHRLLTAACLTFALGAAGCAKAPFTGAPMPIEADEDGFDALAKPINMEAVALAKTWSRDADQVGVMINRSPRGVQDTATFVFASRAKGERMLLVIAAKGGVTAQEIAINDRTAQGLANAAPLTKQQGELLNSKKLFKMAEAAGLKNAEDVVVLNTRTSGGVTPVAIVSDASATKYIVMNGATGDPLTPVSTMGGKRLQVHILVIGAVVLTVAVGAAVFWAVKKWREKDHDKPTPKPSGQPSSQPTPIPSATPVPTPVPTSQPATPIREVLAPAFGEMFDRLDGDKDGRLTLNEYLKPAADDATKRVKTKEFQEFIDRGHSGVVTRNDFLAGIERSVAHMCGISFSMLDQNQDRGLDRGEVGKALKDDEFQAADTNGDAKLTNNEYLVAFAKKEAIYAGYYR